MDSRTSAVRTSITAPNFSNRSRRLESQPPIPFHRRLMTVIAAAAALLLIISGPATATPMAVIQLNHRTADEIIPILTPFLSGGDSLSGDGFLLFVGAAPERLVRIREMVAHLDQAPHQLIITVVQGENAVATLQELAFSGSVAIGDDVSLGTGKRRPPENRLDVRVRNERRRRQLNDIQRIRVQSGQPATITVGLSLPEAVESRRHEGMRYHAVQGYRQLMTGVRVVAHRSGQRVVLDLETRRDRPADGGHGSVQQQGVQTRVEGRVGEWIEIGAVLGQSTRSDTGIDTFGSGTRQRRNQIFIRVEDAP